MGSRSVNPPFAQNTQLTSSPQPFPAYPTSTPNLLRTELSTPILDSLKPYLPFIARKSHSHIDALHLQKIKGRRILITENPGLHLVWYYDAVFLKPIPAWLGNWEFWEAWICCRGGRWTAVMRQKGFSEEEVGGEWCPMDAACGFLRTYAFLVRHLSDFRIAVEAGLVPSDDNIDYSTFSRFISQFRDLPDTDVSPRYCYGQMRLTRLNWAVRLLRPPSAKGAWNYHGMYWQTGQYIESFFGPLMFGFASLAVVFSAMHVMVSFAGDRNAMSTEEWEMFRRVSWGFSAAIVLLVLVVWLVLFAGVCIVVLAQIVFSVKQMGDNN